MANVTEVLNIAALRTITGTTNQTVELLGYIGANDGGGGVFYWETATTAPTDDNGGTIIVATGITTGRWVRVYDGNVNVKWFGAQEGVDSTVEIQAAIDFVGSESGEVYFPPGTYLVSDRIDIPTNIAIRGDGPDISVLNCELTSNLDVFKAIGISSSNTNSLKISGLTFQDTRGSNKQGNYAIFIDGILNAIVENCQFKNLAGGAVKTIKTSNVTVDKCYVWGCGVNMPYPPYENGAIHIDRATGFSNTLNVLNTYVSNCTLITGVLVATHATRIVNVTVESCHTLLKLGSSENISRCISVFGLFMENPVTYGIDIINVRSAIFVDSYCNDSGSDASKSVRILNSQRIRFENCELGAKGFDISNDCADVTFESCTGTFPEEGISGVNEHMPVKDVYLFDGYLGTSNNYISNSNDLSAWSGSGTVTPGNDFIDGSASFTFSKATASFDNYFPVTRSFLLGEKIVASIYTQGGSAIRLRGRRSSDNVFEDIKLVSSFNAGWKRIFVSAVLDKNYNLIHFRVTPGNYGTASASCKVSRAQFEIGRVSPGPYVNTSGTITNNVSASVNGNISIQGHVAGYRASAPATGKWNIADLFWNENPAGGSNLGWICVSPGTPGTWMEFGHIGSGADSSSFNGDGTTLTFSVIHNLGYTPANVVITPTSVDAAAASLWVSSKTATTFVVTVQGITPPVGTNNVSFDWISK